MKEVIMEVQYVPLLRMNKYVCWMKHDETIIGHKYTFAEACEMVSKYMRFAHSKDNRYKLLIRT